ncbi:MAG TPA: hypothetical protein VN042_02160, partial [Asticcacaulis sp.]|nr:hypothetical protein [Asticcacaulis sp.]
GSGKENLYRLQGAAHGVGNPDSYSKAARSALEKGVTKSSVRKIFAADGRLIPRKSVWIASPCEMASRHRLHKGVERCVRRNSRISAESAIPQRRRRPEKTMSVKRRMRQPISSRHKRIGAVAEIPVRRTSVLTGWQPYS